MEAVDAVCTIFQIVVFFSGGGLLIAFILSYAFPEFIPTQYRRLLVGWAVVLVVAGFFAMYVCRSL